MATGAFESNQKPFDVNVDLGYYRRMDKKEAVNTDGELIPEKETLNVRYVNEYLQNHGVTPDNFDKNFTMNTAIDLTSARHSSGEAEMFNTLTETKNMLDKWNLGGLMESMNESLVKSNVHYELEKRKELGNNNEAKLLRGYYTYRTVKKYCDRMYKISEQFSQTREKQKTGIEKGVKEEFAGVLNSVKENFGNMDGKQKMLLVVAGIIGAGMLLGSKSPRVDKIRETIWTCMKIGGFAWVGNNIFKVFTGKTALQTVSDWSKSNVATMEFWTKTYKTNSEQAEILQASTMYLGDIDIMRLAKDYQHARDTQPPGKQKIHYPTISGKDMSDEQVYIALDVFFQKYPVDQVKLKYQRWKPAPTWREVVGNEMISDGSIDMPDSVLSQTADSIHSTVNSAYNYAAPKVESAADYLKSGKLPGAMAAGGVAVGTAIGETAVGAARAVGGVAGGVYEGLKGAGKVALAGAKEVGSDVAYAAGEAWEWVKGLFRKNNNGQEGTDDQVKEWSTKYIENYSQSRKEELGTYLHEKIVDKKNADGYENALKTGSHDQISGVNIEYIKDNDAIYVVAGSHVQDVAGNVQGIRDSMQKADVGAREFLKRRFPKEVGDKIDTYAEFNLGAYVVNEASYKVFMRMPLPGTVEFNQRKAGHWTPEAMRGRTDVQIFGPENRFEYDALKDWQQYNLRLRFLVDGSQTDELNAIVDRYNRLYQDKGWSIDVVGERMMNSQQDFDEVFHDLNNTMQFKEKQKLAPNNGLLQGIESEFQSLENDAAADVIGSKDVKNKFEENVRRTLGVEYRLAILGDREWRAKLNYEPGSSDSLKRKTPKDLLKIYKVALEKEVKKENQES